MVVDVFENDMIAVVAEHNQKSTKDGIRHKLACIMIHPKRNPRTKEYDYALLTTKNPITPFSRLTTIFRRILE